MIKQKIPVLVLLLLCTALLSGCKQPMMETVFPSMFGEDAVLGETKEERREVVYGYVSIDLAQSFLKIGVIDIMWPPAVKIPGLASPQFLTTTFYGHSGIYYLTQWTQLGTDNAYFQNVNNVVVKRWNALWQELDYVVLSNTANHEYAQYFDYLKKNGKTLSTSYTVKIYSKRFSGRIIVRVLEFTPTEASGAAPIPFQELYPLQPYATVVVP